MNHFHEDKLWQEAYIALMELHDAFSTQDAPQLFTSAGKITAMIADALTRRDRRRGREIIAEAVSEAAKTRSHLAVVWGRKLIGDGEFQSLDDRYAKLSESLQEYR